MNNYVSYQNLLSSVNIDKGDVVNVTSDVLKLMLVCRENGEKFDPNLFIDSILEKVGPEGTVLFPTYSWAFCKGIPFDYYKTPSETGGLSNTALQRKDFKRTKHPIYSFAVWGKDQDLLVGMENVNSFSEDSPFGYLYRKDAKNLFVGIDYKDGCAFVHYAEEVMKVSWRYQKEFTGQYTDEKGVTCTKTYRFFVRDLKMIQTEISPRADEVLALRGHYKKHTINGIPVSVLNLEGTGDVFMQDLRMKQVLVYPKWEPRHSETTKEVSP